MLRYLMNDNLPVLIYDLDDQYMAVLNNEMLPYGLRDYVQTTSFSSAADIKKSLRDLTALRDFFSGRVLAIGRSNAKAILGSSALPRPLDTGNMIRIAETCHGLSINDNFWTKAENEDIRFEDIDIRRNSLSQYAYPIAILGKYISVTARELRPELVTGGMFPKVWKREGDSLELWKTDATDSFVNTLAEINASDILDHSNVNHVRYEKREQDGWVFAVSRCVSTGDLSHVTAQEVRDWCEHTGKDFLEFVESRFPGDFHRMVFTDYVLANTDRHSGNWWFQVDAGTNRITSLGALMDHNQALIADTFGTDIAGLVYEPTGLTFEKTIEKYAACAGEIEMDENVLPEKCLCRYKHVKNMGKCRTLQSDSIPDWYRNLDESVKKTSSPGSGNSLYKEEL